MKAAHSLLFFGLGSIVGWGVPSLLGGPDRGVEVGLGDAADGGTEGQGALTSTGRGPGSNDERLLRRELEEAMSGMAAMGLEEATKRGAASSPVTMRGWSALLTMYALGNRAEDFLRVAPAAVRSGIPLAEVLDAVRLFPPAARSEVLRRLMGATPATDWPADHVSAVMLEAGDREGALDVLATALGTEAHRDLIDRMVATDPARAAALLTKLAAEKDWPARRLGQAADALAGAGRPELAMGLYQAGLAREPLDRRILEGLVAVAPDAALAHARRVAGEQAANPAAWSSLGMVELAAGNPQDAFEAYRQSATRGLSREALTGMMQADPQRAYAAAVELAGPQADDETLGVIARIAVAGDRTKESVDALLRAHDLDPSDPKWNAGLVAMDPVRAARVLAGTVDSYKGRHREDVVGAYGDALLESGNPRAAFDRFREALEIDPGAGAWQQGLARADPSRAIPFLEARRRAVGDRGDLLGALADAYAGTGRADEARALYEQAAQRSGGVRWYARLALLDPSTARIRLETAVARDPRSSEAWGALGDCHRAAGNASAARDAYAKAAQLDPGNLTWAVRARAPAGPAR